MIDVICWTMIGIMAFGGSWLLIRAQMKAPLCPICRTEMDKRESVIALGGVYYKCIICGHEEEIFTKRS